MITGDELQHNMAGIYGVIIGLLSAAMLAASMVMIKQVHQTEKTALFPLMFIISLSGTVALIFPSLFLNAENFYPTSWKDWGLNSDLWGNYAVCSMGNDCLCDSLFVA